MSLDSNLYEKSIKILTDLISFKTISGKDNGPLIDYCDDILKKNGVSTFRVFDDNKERVNLFGTIKAKNPNTKKPIILSATNLTKLVTKHAKRAHSAGEATSSSRRTKQSYS